MSDTPNQTSGLKTAMENTDKAEAAGELMGKLYQQTIFKNAGSMVKIIDQAIAEAEQDIITMKTYKAQTMAAAQAVADPVGTMRANKAAQDAINKELSKN